jgi:dephospho-CoA kinase
MSDSAHRQPFVIGVTGNIACGKSLVLGVLAELGAETIDADRLYHELIEPEQPLVEQLRARFGDAIVMPGGGIDRPALSEIVFADRQALADLDALTHPAVIEAARERIRQSKARVLAIDAVKLVESGLYRECDQVWLVECAPQDQLDRLMLRNGFNMDEALQRIQAQSPMDAKRSVAEVAIDNSGTTAQTREQVVEVWRKLPILQS